MPNVSYILRSFIRDREVYELNLKQTFSENKVIIFSGLLLYVVVMLIRSWGNFSQPGLYAEDTAHYFNFYYGNIRSLGDIFQHPNGYYNIYNNLVAFLVAKADILIQPLLYQLVSIILCVLTVAAFSLSGLIRSKYILFISPFFLGLSGFNHLYYYISLTFQMYVGVLLLLVLLFWQRNSSASFNIIYFLVASLLIWSGPYSVLIVPFCLVFMLFFAGKDLVFFGLLLVALAYTFSVSDSTIMLGNLFHKEILLLWGNTLVTQVFFLGLKDSVNLEKLLLIAGTLIPLLIYLRKERFYLKIAMLFFLIIISSFAPLFLSKKYLLYQSVKECHVLIAQFFWVAFLLYSADNLILKQRRYQHLLGTGLVLTIAFFIIFHNSQKVDMYRAPILTPISNFLHSVKEAEQKGLKEKHQFVIISSNGTDNMFSAVAIVGDRSKESKEIGREDIR
ncbi:MAG: hypothetical protein PHZ02_03940 [Desulfocapsaceae bacterium]|nr:hypothetical protein [Desulfocapsaceae bacterium]